MRQKQSAQRPQIWVEGQQNPRFDPWVFAEASLWMARQGLSGLLQRCAHSAQHFAGRVAQGHWQIPAHRLGRSGQYLPSSARTSAAISGGAEVLDRAACLVLPRPVEPLVIALPSLNSATKVVANRPKTPPAQSNMATVLAGAMALPPEPDPDVLRIRALLADVDEGPQPSTEMAAVFIAPVADDCQLSNAATGAPETSDASLPTFRRRLGHMLLGQLALVLGYWMLALSLPYGACRAGIAHLSGVDLRKIR